MKLFRNKGIRNNCNIQTMSSKTSNKTQLEAEEENHKTRTTVSNRVGMIYSIGKTDSDTRKRIKSDLEQNLYMSNNTSAAITAIMQYHTCELISCAMKHLADGEKGKMFRVDNIVNGIKSERKLSYFYSKYLEEALDACDDEENYAPERKYMTYIHRILKKEIPTVKVAKKSKLFLNELVDKLFKEIIRVSVLACLHAGRKTVNSKDVEHSISVLFQKELAVDSMIKCTETLTKFDSLYNKDTPKTKKVATKKKASTKKKVTKKHATKKASKNKNEDEDEDEDD